MTDRKPNTVSKAKPIAKLALGALVAVGVQQQALAASGQPVKCYGVSLAGKNDCGAHGHSCAGQAKHDYDPYEWIFVESSLCNKIGGSTSANQAKSNCAKHATNVAKACAIAGVEVPAFQQTATDATTTIESPAASKVHELKKNIEGQTITIPGFN